MQIDGKVMIKVGENPSGHGNEDGGPVGGDHAPCGEDQGDARGAADESCSKTSRPPFPRPADQLADHLVCKLCCSAPKQTLDRGHCQDPEHDHDDHDVHLLGCSLTATGLLPPSLLPVTFQTQFFIVIFPVTFQTSIF